VAGPVVVARFTFSDSTVAASLLALISDGTASSTTAAATKQPSLVLFGSMTVDVSGNMKLVKKVSLRGTAARA
jgi:hypothetical protein